MTLRFLDNWVTFENRSGTDLFLDCGQASAYLHHMEQISFTQSDLDKEKRPLEEKMLSSHSSKGHAQARIRVQLRCGNSRKREIHSMDSCQDRAGHCQGHEPKL
ncbi:protein FRG2 [Cebus imitator]|uniref:protein FRG2 n=1 Tax=Cebus imitator TaxID=2715852 RepID=UPI00189A3BBA|nr:protein FRG2 [Cebus imitator]